MIQAADQQLSGDLSLFWRFWASLDSAPDWFKALAEAEFKAGNLGQFVVDSDLRKHIAQYRAEIGSNNRVIAVAHSQGNLYANEAYRLLYLDTQPVPPNSFNIVSVATPADLIEGGGPYTTRTGDIILLVPGALLANTPYESCGTPLACHVFKDSYLTRPISRARILDNIIDRILRTQPQIVLTPERYDFGSVALQSSARKDFAIQNTGGSTLTINSIQLSSPGDFTITAPPMPLSVLPGSSNTLAVFFKPTISGLQSVGIRILSNVAAAETVIPVSGTGSVTTPPAPQIQVTPASWSFSTVNVGSTAQKTFTISNPGTANLLISDISTQNPPFAIANRSSNIASIAPNTQATFDVIFTPIKAGPFSGNVAISSNASTQPTSVTLTGTGTNPPPPSNRGGGPAGGNIRALAVDPSNPAIMYAGTVLSATPSFERETGGGVFKTTDGGQNWTAARKGLPDTQVQSLAVDTKNPDTVYAGTYPNGIFKTVDGGQNWNAVNTGLTQLGVLVVAVDPSNSSTVYAGTQSDGGLFRSTNGGQSWAPVNMGSTFGPVLTLAFNPINPLIMYVGTSPSNSGTGGFFKSTDGGQTWNLSNAGLVGVSIAGIAVDSTNPAVLYVAHGDIAGGASVSKSIDGGQSWTLIALRLGVNSILIDPSLSTTLYAAGISGFFKSTDGGASWVAANSGLTDTRVQALVLNPARPSTLYLGTSSDGAFKSADGGQSWSMANTGMTARSVNALVVDPLNSSTLYAGSLMSLFKTTDAGATWSVVDNGIDPMLKAGGEFHALTVDPTDSNTVYAGGDIPTTLKSTNAGQSWAPLNEPFLNSVFAIVVDPTVPSTVYAGCLSNGVLKSTNGGQNWSLTPLLGPIVTSLALDPSAPATLYAGSFFGPGGVYKTTDGAQSWTQVFNGSVSSVVAISAIPNTILYVGTFTGDVAKSIDGGATWSFVRSGIMDASGAIVSVRTVAVDSSASVNVYAGTFGAGIFKSMDGGQSWSAINTGLPNLRILRLVVDPASSSTIYAATFGAGVFKSTDAGQTWRPTGAN